MELTNDFSVSAPIDRAWAILTDLELIAPCMPGAQLQEVEGDDHRGIVKVKVGPITASFKGVASFLERDETAHTAVLKAQGRDTGGKGNANATITARLEPEGDGTTHVTISTDLNITGRVAQFGRGALVDVSTKLLGQFVDCVESKVLSGDGPSVGAASGLGDAASGDDPGEPAPATDTARDGAPTSPAEDAPVVRRVDSPVAAPVDLLDAAGAPLAKRLLPVGLVVLVLLLVWRRRRR